MKKNPFGKNNFDKLEAAGLVSTGDDGENLKAKTEARVAEITDLITKVGKVQAHLATLFVMPKAQQLKELTRVQAALKKLHAKKLPTGTKRYVEACLNEVTSLREGVYVSNTQLDRKTLALTASVKAKAELEAMVVSAQHRLEKVMADSSNDMDMEEFYKKAGEIIKRNDHEATKLAPLAGKPFIFTRVPVVPVDGNISPEKLPRLGFKAESIGGSPPYAVIHNQLVLGINPGYLSQHDPEAAEAMNELNRKIKEVGMDLDDVKKAVLNLKRAEKEVEDLKAQQKDGRKIDDKRLAIMENAVTRLSEKVTRFTEMVGDPDQVAKLENSLKRSHAKLPAEIKAEAERLTKLLEKKLKVKLRWVSEKPKSQNNGVWFWLMPDRELDQLARATPGRAVKITRWGFAFN